MMSENKTGAQIVAELAGKDLNKDGRVVNLVICGNSKFMIILGLKTNSIYG